MMSFQRSASFTLLLALGACGSDSPTEPTDACDACDPLAACNAEAAAPCACPNGYTGDGTTAGTGCTNIDECADGTDDCVDAAAGGTCADAAGSFSCGCASGYAGDGTTGGTGCANVDECGTAADNCVAAADGGTCTDADGTFACGCAAGYVGDGLASGTGCADVDECAAVVSPCLAGVCVNTDGSFACHGYLSSSPFQNLVWFVNPVDSTVMASFNPSLPDFTVTGTTAIRQDPTTGIVYAVAKVSGVTGRVLVTVDLATGVYTQVGNLGDNFATIEFREDGQLFGVTGKGATTPKTLYLIDKATGATTLARALGNGADGEVIVHNPDDDSFYHFSGNSTMTFEKIADTAPYDITAITITGTPSNEVFGAIYLGGGEILISNISSKFNVVNIDGTWGAAFGSNPDDLRGLSYLAAPAIVVDPDKGAIAGGDVVTITGRFAGDINGVTVGGQPATTVTQAGDVVTFTTPAGAAGAATIVVTGSSSGGHTFTNAFTYE